MEKISVTIICRNEEKNIEECIRGVLWADEIVVIDAFSTDKTVEIASKFNVRIIQNEWLGYAKQREFALSKCNNDWVFSIDADERCTPELEKEIEDTLNSSSNKFSGFKIPRKNFFLGKWVKHCGWYPGYQLRLFKKSCIKVTDRLIHEGYELNSEPGILKNDLIHFTVQSIDDYMTRVNHYSTMQALEKRGRKNVKFRDIFLRPLSAYLQQYFLKGGFLDGITGLMVVNFHVMTNMLTYMKIWEMQNKKNT